MKYNYTIAPEVDPDKALNVLQKVSEYSEMVFKSLRLSKSVCDAESDDLGDITINFSDESDCFKNKLENDKDQVSKFIKAEANNIYVSLKRAHKLFDNIGFLDAVRFDLRQIGDLNENEVIMEYVSIHLANVMIRICLF